MSSTPTLPAQQGLAGLNRGYDVPLKKGTMPRIGSNARASGSTKDLPGLSNSSLLPGTIDETLQRAVILPPSGLPHAPTHTSHTLVNMVPLRWTTSTTEHSSPTLSQVDAFDASSTQTPSAAQTHVPAVASSTARDGCSTHGIAASVSCPPNTTTISWRRYQLKARPQDCEHADAAIRLETDMDGSRLSPDLDSTKAEELWTLLSGCAALESRARVSTSNVLRDMASGKKTRLRPTALNAIDYLGGRLFYCFDDNGDQLLAEEAKKESDRSEAAMKSTSSAAASIRANRKRKRDAQRSQDSNGQSQAATDATGPAPQLQHDKTSSALPTRESDTLPSLWTFEAAQSSQYRFSQTKPDEQRAKVGEQAGENVAEPTPTAATDVGEDIALLRQRITDHIATHFDLKATGTLNPASSATYPSLSLDKLSDPALLQCARRSRRPQQMFVRALRERLMIDFVGAHDSACDELSFATTAADTGTPTAETIAVDQNPRDNVEDQEASQNVAPDQLGSTEVLHNRPRSTTLHSSSEEGEISEAEPAEDGEIEEDSMSEQVPGRHSDQPLLPELASPQLPERRLPAGPIGQNSPQLCPFRFGSMVLMTPAATTSFWDRPKRDDSPYSVVSVRFRVCVGPQALLVSAVPTKLWIKPLGAHQGVRVMDDNSNLEDPGVSKTPTLGPTSVSGSEGRVRVLLAPFGFGDDELEARWCRLCLPRTHDIYHEDDDDNTVRQSKRVRSSFELVGILSDKLSDVVAHNQTRPNSNDSSPPAHSDASKDSAQSRRQEDAWWVTAQMRDRLVQHGVDLRVLGTQPRWALLRRSAVGGTQPTSATSLNGDSRPGILEGSQSTAKVEADTATPGVAIPSVQSSSNVFLWPLQLCFLDPLHFAQAHSGTVGDVGPQQRVLPFNELRGPPIYVPRKPYGHTDIADVLQLATTGSGDHVDRPSQVYTPAVIASSSGESIVDQAAVLTASGSVPSTLSSENVQVDHNPAMIDHSYGLPSRRLLRERQVGDHPIRAEEQSTLTSAGSAAANPQLQATSSTVVTGSQDLWSAVLGVDHTQSTFRPSGEVVAQTTEREVPTVARQVSPQQLARRQDVDGFDAMELVTEDDFSFFDNAFDFGAFGNPSNITSGSLPLPSSSTEFFQSIATLNDATTSIGDAHEQAATMFAMPAVAHQLVPSMNPTVGPISADTGPSQTATEHLSLPGFTPSSNSVSSPAFGLNGQPSAKTPRTPFSPSDDLVDDNITVHTGGGYPSLRQHLAAIGPTNGRKAGEDWTRSERPDQSTGAIQPQDLHSKYDSGKFALPNGETSSVKPATTSPHDVSVTEEASRRTPGPHRFRFVTRRVLAKADPRAAFKKAESEASAHAGQSALISQSRPRHGAALRGPAVDEVSEADGPEFSDLDISSESSDEQVGDQDDDLATSHARDDLARLLAHTEALIDEIAMPTWLRPGIARSDDKADAPSDVQPPSPELESEQEESWRRFVLECIANNPPLRALALSQQSDSLVPPPVTAQETKQLFERWCWTLCGSGVDMHGLLLEHLVRPGLAHDLGQTELPVDSVPIGGSPADSDSGVEVLEPPHIMAGCQGYVTRMVPTGLKFWDKLGLSAIGGPKHVAPFVLQLDASDYLMNSAVKWLERIDNVFKTYGLGSHRPNSDSILRLDDGSAIDIAEVLGAMAMDDAQQERWEDTMRSILGTLKTHASDASHIVIYVVGTPGWPLRWQGLTRMRQDLGALARQLLGIQGWQLQMHGVPQTMIFESGSTPLGSGHRLAFDLKRFAFSIYDSLARAVLPVKGRRSARGQDQPDLLQYPAFILAPLYQRHMMDITLRLTAYTRDVVDRGLLLHIGYELRAAQECVVLTVVDQRGQSMYIDVFKTRKNLTTDLATLWLKAIQMSRRSNITWRVVICKPSPMSAIEVNVWSSLARSGMLQGSGILDVTLACVDTDTPLPFLPTADAPNGVAKSPAAPGAVLLDSSRFSYALYPSHRMSVPAPTTQLNRYKTSARSTSSSAPQSRSQSPVRNHDVDILALASSATIRVPLRTDHSTASTGTFSTHLFSSPVHQAAPHTLWLHILQVYSNQVRMPTPASRLHGREGHYAHDGYATQLDPHEGGHIASGSHPELGGARQGRRRGSKKAHTGFQHFYDHHGTGKAGRHASPLADVPASHSTAAALDYPSVSSSGGPIYGAGSPSLTSSGAGAAQAAATAATVAAAAAARTALNVRVRDITQSMHELQLLSVERYSLAEPAGLLPAHLGLLAVLAPGLASYSSMARRPSLSAEDGLEGDGRAS